MRQVGNWTLSPWGTARLVEELLGEVARLLYVDHIISIPDGPFVLQVNPQFRT